MNTLKNKKYNLFRPKIRSRHSTHDVLRDKGTLKLLPFKSVVRLGSSTRLLDDTSHGGNRIECNTVEAVQNSANKLKMKHCFTESEVCTADWWIADNHNGLVFHNNGVQGNTNIQELPYPIVAKHIYGSRGTGNTLIKTREELESWIQGKTLNNYIFEKFYNYSREYRLHVTEDGCFYTCRKMLKNDTPDDQRWYRNDSNSVWIVEENEQFDKPVNWDSVIAESVKALKAVGLDIGAIDLRIQSRLDGRERVRENPEFIVVEINSAPSFGEITSKKYIEQIPKVLQAKYDRIR